MNSWEAFYGPNVGYALELYERYRQDPNSVDAQTRAFFDQMGQSEDVPSALAELARPATRTAVATQARGYETNGKTGVGGQTATANGQGGRQAAGNGSRMATTPSAVIPSQEISNIDITRIVAAARLARSIREYGHLDAAIDPLSGRRPGDPMLDGRTHGITDRDLRELPASIVWPTAGPEMGTCLDAMDRLRAIYSGTIGYDFDHVENFDERTWLHAVVENGNFRTPLSAEHKRALLERLTRVDSFERFLHTAYQGQKRFSIEGNDSLVPMLDELLAAAHEAGVREVSVGMAHRGRLNVLAHTLGKPYAAIFAEFQGGQKDISPPADDPIARSGGGDVKYHLGAKCTVKEGKLAGLEITLADNPSHLEVVNPVIQGFARAAQDDRHEPGAPVQDVDRAFAIILHGDAAFPGEGVVAETLNLSALEGYRTGGSVHIIVNNQVGFTTGADEARSTLYASDLAKGFEIPIVHVNADDPEACLAAARLAYAYRNHFHKDFLIDLVGYRRWGHNEGDEPSYTQPRLYAEIARHPRVRELYARKLIDEGAISEDEAAEMERAVRDQLRAERDHSEGKATPRVLTLPADEPKLSSIETGVPADELRAINQALLTWPEDFTPNPKLERVMMRRREQIDRPGGIDWGFAEILAFGSILAGGTPIRLSGQDAERGTFSQRHLVLHDPNNGKLYIPLQKLPQAGASFVVYNSPLTETAVLAFEYGYSVHAPDALVLWEAQYGDFANVGQVIIDQFISAARSKWQQQPALVLLLPHGYEGQGPEHSSARLERYLQLAADGNMRIANPTSAAQYFHLLRLQAASLDRHRRPLVVMTPKSLLRKAEAASSLDELAGGRFQPIIDDASAAERREQVSRLILCSGKVAIDLATSCPDEPVDWIAIARVEQLFPFPQDELAELLGRYPNLHEVVWLQEEPKNMGAWGFMEPRVRALLPADVSLRYVGRPERASVAEGSSSRHEREQERIVEEAYSGERAPRIKTRGDHNVD